MSDPVLSDDAPSLYPPPPPPPPSFSVLVEPREEEALLLDPTHEPVLGDDEGDEVTTAAPLSSLLYPPPPPPPPPPPRHHNEETDADVSLMLPDARAVVQNWSRNNNNNAATSVSYGGPGLQECGGNSSLMAPPPPPLPDVSTIGYGEGGDVAMIRPLYDTIIDMPYIDRRAVRPIVVSVFCRVAKKIVAVTASSSKEKVEEKTAAVSPSAAEASTSSVAEDSDARPRTAATTVGTDSLLEQPSAPPTKEYWEDKGSLRCPLWPDTRLGELVLCLLRRSESLEALLTSYCERRALPLQSFPVHEVTSRISMLKLSVSVGRTESAESQRVVEHGRLGSLRFTRDGPGAKGFPFVCATPSKRTAGAAAMGGLEWTAESLVAQLVSPQQKLMLLIGLDEIRLDQSIVSA